MGKKYLVLMSLILLLGVIFGCSTKKEQFTDKNIIFNVISTKTNNEFKSYTIEISNKTGFDLTHLTFDLSYPIKTPNGSKGNPFAVEGKTDNATRPVKLNTGETITYLILAPINDVFGDTDLLDFDNPNVEFKGYVINENKEVPFGISGGLSGLVENK